MLISPRYSFYQFNMILNANNGIVNAKMGAEMALAMPFCKSPPYLNMISAIVKLKPDWFTFLIKIK